MGGAVGLLWFKGYQEGGSITSGTCDIVTNIMAVDLRLFFRIFVRG